MGVYIALLRGINVGGNNKLPMKDLVALFEKAGCAKVTTYIQSGNVIFQADASLAKKIAVTMNKAVLKNFKIDIPFVVRSAEGLKKAAKQNPFLKEGKPEETLHLVFLADIPSKAAIQSLDSKKSAPDEFKALGQEIYCYLPNGMGRTKLTNQYFDSKLKTVTTVRNWNTVLKLIEMSGEL